MKITLQQSEILKGVNIVSKALPIRTTMPILECIIIDASANEIKLTANNIELGIETIVEGNIIEPGVVGIEAKFLGELVRKLPSNEVTIDTDDRFHTTIICEKAEVKVSGKSAEDFVHIPIVARNNPIVISELGLKDLIRQTSFAAAQNNNNKLMTGEYFELSGSKLKAVALDGNRVAIRNVNLKEPVEDSSAIIPVKTLNEISKIMNGGAEDMVSIYITENHIIFEYEKTTVVSDLISGEYFMIDKMISPDFITKMSCDKKQLSDILDRFSIMSNETDKKPIVFSIEGQTVRMSIDSFRGSMNEELEIKKEGDDMVIGFNPKFLMDAIRAIDEDFIDFYFLNSRSPAIIKDADENYNYVVLPINIGVR